MSIRLLFFRVLLFAILAILLFSCARTLTPEQAAGGGHKRGRVL